MVFLALLFPVRRERHAAGALQRGLADHAGVSVIPVPDMIVFVPSWVLLDEGEPCSSRKQDTPPPVASARLLSCCVSLLSHALSHVHRQASMKGDQVDGMNGDLVETGDVLDTQEVVGEGEIMPSTFSLLEQLTSKVIVVAKIHVMWLHQTL